MGREKATSGRLIEVTPAMIEAGTDVYWSAKHRTDTNTLDEPEEAIAAIYRAMRAVSDAETKELMAEIFGE